MKNIVHCRKEKFDVYIGRPGPWGNPYIVGKHGSREQVIAKFEKWLMRRPSLVARVRKELKGKILGCWCSPYNCHGEVLTRIANQEGGHNVREHTRNSKSGDDA
jgi:hypothetical protein